MILVSLVILEHSIGDEPMDRHGFRLRYQLLPRFERSWGESRAVSAFWRWRAGFAVHEALGPHFAR